MGIQSLNELPIIYHLFKGIFTGLTYLYLIYYSYNFPNKSGLKQSKYHQEYWFIIKKLCKNM